MAGPAGVVLDQKAVAAIATKPVGTGPFSVSAFTSGYSVTLDEEPGATGARRPASTRSSSATTPTRTRRSTPSSRATSTSSTTCSRPSSSSSSRSDPEEVHARAGPDERQGPAEHEQLAPAAEQQAGAPGDQLRDRPPGPDQDGLRGLRQADRHARLARRPVVPEPREHVPVQPGEGEEAARAGRLPERLQRDAAGAARRLRDRVEHLRAVGARSRSASRSSCRTSTSSSGSTRSSRTRTTT